MTRTLGPRRLQTVDYLLLATYGLALVALLALLLMTAPAHGQNYWGWGPYQPQPLPRAAKHHAARHAPQRHSTHTRSAAEWKASIQAQGRAYCRAHPSDRICPR